MQNYRSSTNQDEIIGILEKSGKLSKNILWQTHSNHRNIFEIDLIDVDLLRGEVKFFLDDTQNISKDMQTYLKLNHRETVFKGWINDITNNLVAMSIPQEVKTTELRENPRVEFSALEERNIVLKIMNDNNIGSFASIKVKLKDVSPRGIGLLVSDKNQPFFIPGRAVKIEQLGKIKMNDQIGEVVYTQKFRYREEGRMVRAFKIGIRLAEPLPQLLIDSFLRNESINVENAIFAGPIILEEEIILKIKEAREITLEKLKSNKITKNFLKELKINRNKDKYLTNHIGLLTNVLCGIAKQMGWVTEATLEKLIYACYVHDIAYFSNPKLARIRDLEHFISVKDRLNKQEEDIFLRGPIIASEVAQQDPDAPEGVDRILLQQKERPDGMGFPHAIGNDRLQPLSALFIVSHDLTDFILLNKNWNLHQYLIGARSKFQGGHFSKIFEHLENLKFKNYDP